MRVTCSVIKDLMPSYIDEICSDDSKKLVESHIQECDKCRRHLAYMKNPVECPEMVDNGEGKEPFKKIKRKNRIQLALAVIITSCVIGGGMFAIQEVGSLHDYFYPSSFATIENKENQMEWQRVQVSEDGYLNFSSIFYEKEVVNDANSSGSVVIRILDQNNNIVLEETTIEPGTSIKLDKLEDNQNYIVEAKCKEGRFFLNFV